MARNNLQELLKTLNQASIESTGQPLQDHVAAAARSFVDRAMDGPKKPKKETPKRKVKEKTDEVAEALRELGLDPSVDDKDQIKNAYHWLAKKYYPDNKETGDEAKMVRLNLAWEVLRDAKKVD